MAKATPEAQRQRVLDHVKRSTRPTLVGHIALELKCSLAEAERILLDLVDEGHLRHATAFERAQYDIREGYLPV